jgi:ubiquinone/menaquinone biosynthesis C-methylase UbiE
MCSQVANHYRAEGQLAEQIARALRAAGKDPETLAPGDLATVDEFHIRGRAATLELGETLGLSADGCLLDIGSGLGGPARTMAEVHGCRVTGVDLTPAFCEAANEMSRWVGLADLVSCEQGDATALPFGDGTFDAAMTIHVAMNIPAKDAMYREAHRVLAPGGTFAVYDVLQGEGGEVLFPVPWARDPSISHLARPADMRELLEEAGFSVAEERDSSAESLAWFEAMAARMASDGPPPVNFAIFLGEDFPAMVQNQIRNLAEDRIRTVAYLCRKG